MGAFSDYAFQLCELGLRPIPTGGDDGKRPLLKRYGDGPVNIGNVEELQRRFGAANVALAMGPSKLAVVDVDDPSLLYQMRRRFGETPLIAKTGGRGGFQLFYRDRDCSALPMDLRSTDGIEVEIKARRNIAVVAPSTNFITGRRYEFVEGRLDEATLFALPAFNVEAVHQGRTRGERGIIEQGRRNNWLFQQCLVQARRCDSYDDLLDWAQTRNDECEPPLRDADVVKIVTSAWGYEQRASNWVGEPARVVYTKVEVAELARRFPGNPLALHMKLRAEHGARVQAGETFRLQRRAMVKAATLEGWSDKHLRSAIRAARDAGLVSEVMAKRGHASQYTLPAIVPPAATSPEGPAPAKPHCPAPAPSGGGVPLYSGPKSGPPPSGRGGR